MIFEIWGVSEEIIIGVIRFCVMEKDGVFKFLIIVVNDFYIKYFFDNCYGIG